MSVPTPLRRYFHALSHPYRFVWCPFPLALVWCCQALWLWRAGLPTSRGTSDANDGWSASWYNDLAFQWAMTPNLAGPVMMMAGFKRPAILDERPEATTLVNGARWLASYQAMSLDAAVCHAVGIAPPRVWSRFKWVVAHRPADDNGR